MCSVSVMDWGGGADVSIVVQKNVDILTKLYYYSDRAKAVYLEHKSRLDEATQPARKRRKTRSSNTVTNVRG